MDPDAVANAERVPHGGDRDPQVRDCSANTNPNTPDGTRDVYADALDEARRYPNDRYPDFREAAADFLGRDAGTEVDPERVVPTPGGLAAIRLAIGTTVSPGDSVLVPAPSFGEYAREVRLQGGACEFLDHDRILDSDPEDHAMAVVCTPNNPTGALPDPDRLQEFARRCSAAGTTLLADEAFLGFTDQSTLARLDDAGVIVARSLTKLFGLPGVRAGFAVASGDALERLETARRTWNCSTPAVRVGAHCLRNHEFVARTRQRVREERARLRATFEDRGIDVAPSEAPYLLVDLGSRPVDRVVENYRARGIAVRDARTFRGLDAHVRIAITDQATNDRVIEATEAILDDEPRAGGDPR